MGLFQYIFGKTKESEQTKRRKNLRNHVCKFEEVEKRELLSATPYQAPSPINFGVAYHEDYVPSDLRAEDRLGDTFIVSWNGGAANTKLTEITINLSTYDFDEKLYFNVDPNRPQASNGAAFPFKIAAGSDILEGQYTLLLSSDCRSLTIKFDKGVDFTADKVLKFNIDVNTKSGDIIAPIVPGKHFENSTVAAKFQSQDYQDLTVNNVRFADDYEIPENSNLKIPEDPWTTADGIESRAMSAGAIKTAQQLPLSGLLSGHVYEDVNDNGLKENGENGIAGVWLELYVFDNGRYVSTGRQTQTNAAGYYCFDDIEGGKTYRIMETQPSAYADGKDTPGTINGIVVGHSQPTDEIADIHIGANEHGINYNFGELKFASLSGYVYHDRNNNGLRETGEEGLAAVPVKLQILDNGVYRDVGVAYTDAAGKYVFNGLTPNRTYRVIETSQPEGFTDGKETAGYVNGLQVGTTPYNEIIEGIALGYDEHGIEYNFGEYKKGGISGNVYEDNNNDGNRGPNEPGIPGVTIWLCVIGEDGQKHNIAQTVTDENGHYEFKDLDPGKTYCVTEFDPEGYCDGKDTVGTINGTPRGEINLEIPEGKDQIHNIYIGSEDNGINYNFAENRRGKISGYVYVDTNDNGVRNTGEAGIEGTVLSLWVWNEDEGRYVQTPKTAITDSNGYYEFTGLCPFKKYQVRETQPEEYNDGQETVGTLGGDKSVNDIISEINMPPAGNGENYNFGELVPPQPQPGSLSGYVYADANNNGSKDGGENGIAGVTLFLWKYVNGQYVQTGRTATTDANGYYRFDNLDPNEVYQITEVQPADYDDGQETVGSLGGNKSVNDVISAILVGDNQHGVNYNFGELEKPVVPPPPLPKGSISGYVYADTNKNGVRDGGESGIQNTTVALYKLVNGTYVLQRTAQTDSSGYYIFSDLAPGEIYAVKETQPADYDDGQETVGSLGGDKSENDYIKSIAVGDNQHGVNYNFGELEKPVVPPPPPELRPGSISGYVYLDANKNGGKDASEYGLRGVSILLYKLVDGSYVYQRSTQTDATGYYIFDNLVPNETYAVYEIQPSDYDDGLETVGSLGGNNEINDYTTAIPVGDNQHGVNYNFGELEKPVVPPPLVPPGPPTIPPTSPPFRGGAAGNPGINAAPNWQPPILNDSLQPGYGGGGMVSPAYSWQLSVINGGYPRDIAFAQATGQSVYGSDSSPQQVMMLNSAVSGADTGTDSDAKTRYVSVNWEANPMNELAWKIRDKDGKERRLFTFGPKEGIPLAADFNGEGIAIPAVYYNGQWYIDKNGDGKWDEKDDIIVKLGTANDQPVVGDWDGDGKADVGIFGPKREGESEIAAQEAGLPSDNNALKMQNKHRKRSKNVPLFDAKQPAVRDMQVPDADAEGKFQTRRDVIDHVFESGNEKDRAFVGDFTGDGIKKIGLYRGGEWFIDKNGNGQIEDNEKLFVDTSNAESTAGGIPVVGDWDGSGIDKIGLFVNGIWYLGKGNADSGFKYETGFRFGEAGDKPVVADFNGDGVDEFAVVRSSELDTQFTMRTPEAAQAQPMFARNAAAQDGNDGETENRQGSLPHQFQRHTRTPKFSAPQHNTPNIGTDR